MGGAAIISTHATLTGSRRCEPFVLFLKNMSAMNPYTEEEHNMVHQAMATIPTDYQEVVPWSKSKEIDEVNKQSPVSGFKGYPR